MHGDPEFPDIVLAGKADRMHHSIGAAETRQGGHMNVDKAALRVIDNFGRQDAVVEQADAEVIVLIFDRIMLDDRDAIVFGEHADILIRTDRRLAAMRRDRDDMCLRHILQQIAKAVKAAKVAAEEKDTD